MLIYLYPDQQLLLGLLRTFYNIMTVPIQIGRGARVEHNVGDAMTGWSNLPGNAQLATFILAIAARETGFDGIDGGC